MVRSAGAIGMLNTTWDDDGESLFDMDWPALIFGASAGWQRGESSIDRLSRATIGRFTVTVTRPFGMRSGEPGPIARGACGRGVEARIDDLFWSDSFSADGAARFMKQALPAAPEIRLGAEQALDCAICKRVKAHANADTLDDMIFAAWRLDTLGMKIQFTQELNKFLLGCVSEPEGRGPRGGGLRRNYSDQWAPGRLARCNHTVARHVRKGMATRESPLLAGTMCWCDMTTWRARFRPRSLRSRMRNRSTTSRRRCHHRRAGILSAAVGGKSGGRVAPAGASLALSMFSTRTTWKLAPNRFTSRSKRCVRRASR